MSCLPIVGKCDSAENILSVMAIDTLPVTANQIANAKAKPSDRTLSTIVTAVQHGQWPHKLTVTLLPYSRQRNELTVMDGCLF